MVGTNVLAADGNFGNIAMRKFRLLVLPLIVCWFSDQIVRCGSVADDDFVDPLDLINYDRATKSMKPRHKPNGEPVHNDRCTAFLSRFVNLLLHNTGLSRANDGNNNNGYLKSYAAVSLSVRDLQLLRTMISRKDIDYLEIDRILKDMFTPVEISRAEFKIESNSFADKFDQIKGILFWLSVGGFLIFFLFVIFQNVRRMFSITFVVFVILALAFASTWYTMYMKAIINQRVHMDHRPDHCKSQKNGWMVFNWFKTNELEECKKFSEAIYMDPIYSIALTEVLSEMLSKMMIKPLETFGESIYKFNKAVLQDFPMWIRLILVPIIIFIIIKTMLLSCALLVGRSVSMKSIFGYGSSTIGSGPSSNIERADQNNRNRPGQSTATQKSELPNVNFNINLFQPSPIANRNQTNNTSLLYGNPFEINGNKKKNTVKPMLENLSVESVDGIVPRITTRTTRRHRTLSI